MSDPENVALPIIVPEFVEDALKSAAEDEVLERDKLIPLPDVPWKVIVFTAAVIELVAILPATIVTLSPEVGIIGEWIVQATSLHQFKTSFHLPTTPCPVAESLKYKPAYP